MARRRRLSVGGLRDVFRKEGGWLATERCSRVRIKESDKVLNNFEVLQ